MGRGEAAAQAGLMAAVEAIWRSVASWKITYGGMPASLAVAERHARKRSNTASPGASRATASAADDFFLDELRAALGASRRSATVRSPRSTAVELSVRTRVP